jgi:phospholipase/lecithinase/hemolysin
VLEYELPAFQADLPSTRNGTNTPYFSPPLSATSAAYALWIGTNDLGIWAFLTSSQVRGTVIPDYLSCIFRVLDGLYSSGARVLVLMNAAPLHLAPLYANATLNGVADNQYWPTKATDANQTLVADTMHEFTALTNALYRYRTPYEALIARRYPGASFALFDVNALMQHIYVDPAQYLNGSQPADVQGFENVCREDAEGEYADCEKRFGGDSPDSFMWFDELHPSTQTDRVIASEFIRVLGGQSTYAEYW